MKKIVLITGTMFSGKTTLLIKKFKECKNSKVLIKPASDERYSKNKVVSHSGDKELCFIVNQNKPHELLKFSNVENIFIDEISLFSEDTSFVIGKLSLKSNIFMSGLLKDFKKDYFPITKKILDFSSEHIELKSKCVCCGEPAKNSQRLINNQPAKKNDPVIFIAGNSHYEPRCDNCYVLIE